MHIFLALLRWLAAIIGLVLAVAGLVTVITQRAPGGLARAFGTARTAGWFFLEFGLALVCFGSAGALSSTRWLSIVVWVVGAVLLAMSLRNRPYQHST
jgi:hypothetical protein